MQVLNKKIKRLKEEEKEFYLTRNEIKKTYNINDFELKTFIDRHRYSSKIRIINKSQKVYHISLLKYLEKRKEKIKSDNVLQESEKHLYVGITEARKRYTIYQTEIDIIQSDSNNTDRIKVTTDGNYVYHLSLFDKFLLRKDSKKRLLKERKYLVKGIKKVCGVYCIKYNNEIIYIGASVDMRNRLLNHFNSIFTKTHSNKSLENFFYENDFNLFSTEVIEECSVKEKSIKEKDYIKKLNPRFNIIYNELDIFTLNKLKEANLKTIHFKNTVNTNVIV